MTGIDLAHPVDDATRKKLYDAVVENVVLVIRGQEHLSPGLLQAAGEMFGELPRCHSNLRLGIGGGGNRPNLEFQ